MIIHIYEKSKGKINGKGSSGTRMGFEVVVTCTVEPQTIRKDKGLIEETSFAEIELEKKKYLLSSTSKSR